MWLPKMPKYCFTKLTQNDFALYVQKSSFIQYSS